METTGYFASILIGISLGLIGGGGSILTVPVLVYLFALDTVLATTYSLFVVGSTSLVGSFSYFKKGLIDLKTAIYFGLPSIATVFLTRQFLLPAIPEKVIYLDNFLLTRSILLMVIFAVLMVFAAYSMIKSDKENEETQAKNTTLWVMLQGAAVGVVTGLIGAGGGFLIIPALVNLLKLPIKTAIGTSLMIIAVNSLAGFGFSLGQQQIQWLFLFSVTTLAIVGIFIGSYLSTKIEGKKLKPAFGWFVLVMGVYILMKEIVLK
ncbi:sulfite exporter TauE/SafE family protein [Pedobacter helvus]|uniref:Probable membrane transporter protein n=1 Tax=Pedobacter helvus TaxID=2563444 RepID=A0ABW9JDB6_9SPHI|nr:sulfite exporter TauE/SafE family protein [Pedobacter ureilyticus]